MLFTRLPLWRIYQPRDAQVYRHAVEYWPFAGWITGGVMATVLTLTLPYFSNPNIPVVLAIASRLLLTGALHEDGLADFCDGMGGGTTRERILQIMKDSHIGTYGVLGLIIYFLLLYNLLYIHPLIILAADVWAKSCASLLVIQLPYARREEEAKVKLTYAPINLVWHLVRILLATAPAFYLAYQAGLPCSIAPLLATIVTQQLLTLYMKHRIQGYTGDCCGATFLLCELSFLLTWTITANL